MPFGILGRTGPGIRQVVGFGDRFTGRGTFGGEFGARHYNQWGFTFAATRPSSQITLSKLVLTWIQLSEALTMRERKIHNCPPEKSSCGFNALYPVLGLLSFQRSVSCRVV